MTIKSVKFGLLLIYSSNAYCKDELLRKIDEVGNSSITISQKIEPQGNTFEIKNQEGRFIFRTTHAFGGSFVAGKDSDGFVWLFPKQEMGRQVAAYLALGEKIAYVINLQPILGKHRFIPFSRSVTGSDEISEFWNINEWSYSENQLSIPCRLNPNDMYSGFVLYDHGKKQVKVIDLRSAQDNSEVTYEFGNSLLPVEKIDIVFEPGNRD